MTSGTYGGFVAGINDKLEIIKSGFSLQVSMILAKHPVFMAQ